MNPDTYYARKKKKPMIIPTAIDAKQIESFLRLGGWEVSGVHQKKKIKKLGCTPFLKI